MMNYKFCGETFHRLNLSPGQPLKVKTLDIAMLLILRCTRDKKVNFRSPALPLRMWCFSSLNGKQRKKFNTDRRNIVHRVRTSNEPFLNFQLILLSMEFEGERKKSDNRLKMDFFVRLPIDHWPDCYASDDGCEELLIESCITT